MSESIGETVGRPPGDGPPFDLTAPSEPWVVFARDDDGTVRDLISAAEPCAIVRRLSGLRMPDPAALFEEFAQQLEFPAHFGRNWYALVDCLDDLHGSWHGRRPVVVVVEQADVLVRADFFALLIALLCEAAEHANLSRDADDIPRERPPLPLHFVLLLSTYALEGVASTLRQCDDLTVTEAQGRLLVTTLDAC